MAWVVANGSGDRYRAWVDGFPAWVDNHEDALQLNRREDAEALFQEDEDAWLVIEIEPVAETRSLRARVELLREAHKEANGALRSAYAVAMRDGAQTNWKEHRAQLRASLDISHAALAALYNVPAYDPIAELFKGKRSGDTGIK